MPSDYSSSQSHSSRQKRELSTIRVMIGMYCQAHHGDAGASPCSRCAALFDYAARRLERCVFGAAKPTCANCAIHCYSANKREQIRVVMRWAGPRMLLRHPMLALFHLLEGRRPAPSLPAKPALGGDQELRSKHAAGRGPGRPVA